MSSSSTSSAEAKAEHSNRESMINELKVLQTSQNMLHKIYAVAFDLSNDVLYLRTEATLESSSSSSTSVPPTKVAIFVRTLLFVLLFPKSTFRQEDLTEQTEETIRTTLRLLGQNMSIPVVPMTKDPLTKQYPTRQTIEQWVKLLSAPLIKGLNPMQEPYQCSFHEWVKLKTGLTLNSKKKPTSTSETSEKIKADSEQDSQRKKRKVDKKTRLLDKMETTIRRMCEDCGLDGKDVKVLARKLLETPDDEVYVESRDSDEESQ